MYGYAFLMFVVATVTMGLSGFVFPFLINKKYATFLLENGFKPMDKIDQEALQRLGLISHETETKQLEAA